MRYQGRGGKHARRNYEESLTLRNKNQKESRRKRQENTHTARSQLLFGNRPVWQQFVFLFPSPASLLKMLFHKHFKINQIQSERGNLFPQH